MVSWKPSADFELWPGCQKCVYFKAEPRFATCIAYPRGIPLPIAASEVDHLVVRPGQAGEAVFTNGDR